MEILVTTLVLFLSYVMGSIPFGLLIVKLFTGKDVRAVESGRTGGTNAMRAAGFWAGLATALLDLLKAAAAVWLARGLSPGNVWLEVFAPILAIAGHNYSIFLIERNAQGRLNLRGGAGGAPCVGGSFGLMPLSLIVILPVGALILYFVGYASVATMSVALISSMFFAYTAWIGITPWPYVLYGLLAEALLVWSLLPNIRRLIQGKERMVGFRARKKKDNHSSSSSYSSSS